MSELQGISYLPWTLLYGYHQEQEAIRRGGEILEKMFPRKPEQPRVLYIGNPTRSSWFESLS